MAKFDQNKPFGNGQFAATYYDPDLYGNKSVVSDSAHAGKLSVNTQSNSGQGTKPQTPAKQPAKQTGSYTVNANNQPYVDQLNSLYDQIMNRKPFKYDLNGDLLYRQMADRYTQLGKTAMRDTMGQAATLTGGYGNSYAQQVGNQAYQQYLTALNDQVPNLYEQAYNVWLNEGNQLLQQYDVVAQHPGILEAISPRTVTYNKTAATPEETETTQVTGTDTDYLNYLKKVFGADSTVANSNVNSNALANWYYNLLKQGKG